MATTYKTTQSKFWFARYVDHTGKRISRSTKTESRREAKRIAAELEAADRKQAADLDVSAILSRTIEIASMEARSGSLTLQRAEQLIRDMTAAASPTAPERCFRAFAAAWLDDREPNLVDAAATGYRNAVKYANTSFGTLADGPLRKITIDHAERFKRSLTDLGLRGRSVNYYVGIVRRIFEAAVHRDIISKNPLRLIKAAPTGDSRKRLPFTVPEIRSLIMAAPNDEWRGLIIMAAQTGIRVSDLLKLSSDNIEGTWLKIVASKTKVRSGEVLRIPLTISCVSWIQGRTGELFPTLSKLPATTVSGGFSRIMDAAGAARNIELAPGVQGIRSFHSLRHSFASALADADVHSDVRMRLTGHATASVHANYSHHEETLQRAVGQLPVLRLCSHVRRSR
jgi:integrase